MTPTTTPQMPMGATTRLPLTAADLIAPLPSAPQGAGAGAVPPGSGGIPGGTAGATFPAPGAPQEPPYDVQLQPDGSSIYVTKTDPPVVLAVNQPPKLPKALQPPKQ